MIRENGYQLQPNIVLTSWTLILLIRVRASVRLAKLSNVLQAAAVLTLPAVPAEPVTPIASGANVAVMI
jgi:hypothetical protein